MGFFLEQCPIALAFKTIASRKATGELTVSGDGLFKTLFFNDGLLQFATSNQSEERLGEFLVRQKLLGAEQLRQLSQRLAASGEKLGKILIQEKVLDLKQLFSALRLQVKAIAVTAFAAQQGEWDFIAQQSKLESGQHFAIKIAEVIREGIDILSDFLFYQTNFSCQAPVTTPIPGHLTDMLSSEEKRLFVQLKNFENMSAERIQAKLNMPATPFWKALSLFFLLNIIDFQDFTVDSVIDYTLVELNDLFARLQAGNMEHHEVLGLPKNATATEMKEVYFQLSKKFHPDRIAARPDSEIKEKAVFVFTAINDAFAALSQKKKGPVRAEIQISPAETAKEADKSGGRALYLRAKNLYAQKRFAEAANLMEQLIQSEFQRGSYFLLLGISQAKIPTLIKKAEENLQQACRLESWNADPVFALGELYFAQKLFKKAEASFRRALEINLDNTYAGMAIKRLESMGKTVKPAQFRKGR